MIEEKNLEETNKNYYRNIEDYDWVNVVDNWKGIETIFHRMRVKTTLRLIQKYSIKGDFLDAGIGTGLILRHLPKGSFGMDINPRNVEKAKTYSPNANIIISDIEKMTYWNNTFSNVICTEVLEHLTDRRKALDEIRRVLKPNSIFIGSVPAKTILWKLRFLSSTCPVEEPVHHNFSKSEIQNLLSDYFEITLLSKANLGMNWVFVCENKKKK